MNENSFGIYLEASATGHGTLTGHVNYTINGRYTLDLGMGFSTDIEYVWRTYILRASALILKQQAEGMPINSALEISKTFHTSYEEDKNNFALEVSRNFKANNTFMITPLLSIALRKPHFQYLLKYYIGLNLKVNHFYFEATYGNDKYGGFEYYIQLGYLF
jgi:hypothetical protein